MNRHALVGPESFWKMKRAWQAQFLMDAGLKREHYLFEIGCGTLRGGIPLIGYLDAGHYFGSEVRDDVLEEGRAELREAGLEAKRPNLMIAPDLSELKLGQRFDFIWSFATVIHMTDSVLNTALGFVRDHLAPAGAFYANVNIGEREEENWAGFPVVWRTLDFYRQACADNGLVLSDLGRLKDLGHASGVVADDEQVMIRVHQNGTSRSSKSSGVAG